MPISYDNYVKNRQKGKEKEYARESKKFELDDNTPIKTNKQKKKNSLAQTVLNSGIQIGKGVAGFGEQVFDASMQFASSKYNPVMHLTNKEKSVKDRILDAGKTELAIGSKIVDSVNPVKNVMKISDKITGKKTKSTSDKIMDSISDKGIKDRQNIAEEIIKKDAKGKFINDTLGYNKKLANGKTIQENLDEKSLVKSTNTAGRLLETVGQQLPAMMTGSEAGSLGLMGISAYGGGLQEAYNNGAAREEANKYGLLTAGIETATEKVFAGVGGVFGKGAIDDVVKTGIKSKIKNVIARKAVDFGLDMIGEGTEEVLSDLLNPIAKKLTYAKKEDLNKLYKDENFAEDFVMGALSSGVMKTMTGSFGDYTTNEEKAINKITETRVNEKSNEKRIENYINEQIKNKENDLGVTLSENEKKRITNKINEDIKSGEVQLNEDKVLSRKEQNEIRKQVIDEIENGKLDVEKYKNEIGNITEKDTNLYKSVEETNKKYTQFEHDTENETNEFSKGVYEDAKKYFNNTQRSHEFVDKVAQISKDRGTQYGFINNETLKSLGHDIEGKQINGLVRTNENGQSKVLINVDSPKALNTIVGHETTHLLEGTNEYETLKESIIEYAKQKNDYDDRIKTLNELYEGVEGANIDNELVSDLVGDYLFTDEKYINQLSTQNKTLFQKIKDFIDDMIIKFKGTAEEKKLREVQKKFNDAYQKNGVSQEGNKYSIIGVKNIKKALANKNIDENTKKSLNKVLDNYNEALSKDGVQDNETIRKELGWFKDKNGDWKYEITDKYSSLKIKPEPNKTYKLGDILDHKLLYDVNPEIKNLKVTFKNLDKGINGQYLSVPLIDKIFINNSLINSDERTIRSTLLHEIQHYNQRFNKFETGLNSGKTLEDMIKYVKGLGEIEAKNVQERMDYSKDELKAIAPESSKENPIHPYSKELIQKRKNEIANKNKILYNKNRGVVDEENVEKNSGQDRELSISTLGDRWRSRYLEGTENSSFFDTKYSISDNDLKQQQLDIVLKNNPAEDDLHTWIRNIDDIKTYEETLNDPDWTDYVEEGFDPDYTGEMVKEALKTGEINVYSSYPIEQGIFVTPSKMEAESYSGNGKIYSKKVNLKDIAWVDPTQGQYAKVENNTKHSLTKDNQGRTLSKQQQDFFKDSKVTDENGNLLTIYHGTPNGEFNTFKAGSYFSANKEYASGYENPSASSISSGKTITTPKTYEVYLNITNPFTLSNAIAKDIYINEYIKGGNSAYFDPYTDYTDTINNMDEIDWLEGEDLKEWIQENHPEFDGLYLDEGGDGGYGMAEYRWRGISFVPFNSNQIKNINNTNPTSNEDIRMSLSNKNQDIAPIGNYNVYGKDIKIQDNSIKNEVNDNEIEDIAPVSNEIKENYQQTVEANNAIDTKYTRKQKTIDRKVNDTIQKQSYKAINEASKSAKRYLDFDNAQKSEFREQLMQFSNMTMEELTNAGTYNNVREIVKQYADKEINFIDEELKAVKTQIRNSKINVNDNLKTQIDDYNDFRKLNFGKLKLSNEGQNVDSLYYELSDQYPYYFSNEITSQADMLYELADFMNKDVTLTEKYRISDAEIEKITAKVYNTLKNNSISEQKIYELQQQLEKQAEKRTRKIVQDELLDEMGIEIQDIQEGNDIKAVNYQLTDPIRVNEKVFGYEAGKKINDATINKTKHNEAERTRFLNKERNEIRKLGIKPRSKESEAVQKYGEKSYINQYGEEIEYTYDDLVSEFGDKKARKISRAANVLRSKYDIYIDTVNDVLTDLGYDPIPKRKNYMRHFAELQDKFSQWGIPFNRNDMNSEDLPTDINGITDEFAPGKSWFASAQQRTGVKTTYDAITGIDGYLEGVSNLIYHTEDIQRYRALSKFIRESFGTSHGFDNIDSMSDLEAEQRIADIQSNKLSKYAAWLDEQANALAGKKAKIDRSAERIIGRKGYAILDTLKKQVGSNMTGFNVRSAMTNFASAVQGASKTNKIAFIKGTISTLNNIVHNDGLIDRSDFLTTRFGSDQISKKLWQKASNAGQIFMTGTDYFTANQIWRSKYYEGLQKGLTEDASIKQADDFSARVMGDRSKGSTAEIFNSKTLGLLTQFQLEVNNQWQSMIHDNKIDVQAGNRTGASVVFQLGQLSAMSYLFNEVMKKATGSSVMLDPIDILKEMFGSGDDDKTLEEKAQESIGKILDNVPFFSIYSGGRIPMQEALEGLDTTLKYATGQKNKYGKNYSLEDVKDSYIESLPYILLPTGYGQLKKTTKGLSMYTGDKEVKGSYTKSGNLRFEADESLPGIIQSGLFGQYASKNARDYVDSGFKSVNKNKISEMKDLGMTATEYKKYREGLNNAGTKQENKINYISSLDISDSKKSKLASSLLNKKVDMSKYKNYDSYEEFNYSLKNKDKYNWLTKNGISYSDYIETEETKKMYDNAYKNVDRYNLGKAAADTYENYYAYKEMINEIKGDQYPNGKTISGSRKAKIINYVNSLDLSIPQKAMLIKEEYNTYKNYDSEIFNYVNNLDLDYNEKRGILNELRYKIDSDGNVRW